MKIDGLMIDPLINNLILSGAASTLTLSRARTSLLLGAKARSGGHSRSD